VCVFVGVGVPYRVKLYDLLCLPILSQDREETNEDMQQEREAINFLNLYNARTGDPQIHVAPRCVLRSSLIAYTLYTCVLSFVCSIVGFKHMTNKRFTGHTHTTKCEQQRIAIGQFGDKVELFQPYSLVSTFYHKVYLAAKQAKCDTIVALCFSNTGRGASETEVYAHIRHTYIHIYDTQYANMCRNLYAEMYTFTCHLCSHQQMVHLCGHKLAMQPWW
jgi:hypothetical protein